MIVHYLLLHEIFPPFHPLIAIPLFAGLIGVLLLPAMALKRRSRKDSQNRPRPPLLRIFLIAASIASVVAGAMASEVDTLVTPLIPFIWAALPFGLLFSWITKNEYVLIWLGSTICWMGIGILVWWIRGTRRGWPSEAADSVPLPAVPPAELRSASDACIHCREAATTGGGPPLARIGHNADGPRFLYRCSSCHAYWEKDVKGMRPVSVLRVRQDYPDVVI